MGGGGGGVCVRGGEGGVCEGACGGGACACVGLWGIVCVCVGG